ncbi:GntR family transcriptional regulator [Arthrobacter agilis]|uniref:GntR family transcriptional regulator n=1 Tax=Arthrobacter agilis TaxID=37921 RepID=A0A2L0UFB0_9MICC|nr:cache domain-containing protein [Arthrobacter agilis]AUZ87940.1 GntR family transcriptional regulator [Arthrobacter agilis]
MTAQAPARTAAAEIAAWMNALGVDVHAFAARTAALWTDRTRPFGLTPGDVAHLEGLAGEFLAAHPFVVGAGVIFSAEAIQGNDGGLEWWIRRQDTVEKLEFDLTPGGERFYDYQNMPFFASASRTGEQTSWGPYVDYLGLDEYILTHSAPIQLGGTFAGVAGCDIRIRTLEEIFMPVLRAIPGDAALINASGRVVVGNSGAYLVGERIRSTPAGSEMIPVEVPHLGFSLLSRRQGVPPDRAQDRTSATLADSDLPQGEHS